MKTPPRNKTPAKNPKMVDLREAAEILKVDPMKLFKMVRNGGIPGAARTGLRWSFELDELARFLEAETIQPK